MTTGNHAAASVILEDLIERYPDASILLNNLAVALLGVEDDRAVDYARRAHSVEPTAPSINDTLGWILVSRGEPQEALGYLREASTRDWADPEIRYHLAVCLADLGRTEEALQELREVLGGDEAFDARADAKRLFDSLRAGPGADEKSRIAFPRR